MDNHIDQVRWTVLVVRGLVAGIEVNNSLRGRIGGKLRKVNALWGRQGLSLNQGWVDLHVMQWLLNKNGIDGGDDTTIQGGEVCISI